jgi:Acyl-CoA reductase (LuxC)
VPYQVPLIIRGRVILEQDLRFGGHDDSAAFVTADVRRYLDELVLHDAAKLADLHALSFDEILDYLQELATHLDMRSNPYLQESCELCTRTSGLTRAVVENYYRQLPGLYRREYVREHAENCIGVRYLEGWVPRRMASGCVAHIRAFGVRSVHVLAGNVPAPSAMGVMRNAITRSDAIFKTPSNDPLTAAAIARTMCDRLPDHPITKHLSVAYWKGGDTTVEQALYSAKHVNKIVAWGGEASMRHIARYVGPGIDLVAMDPKLSSAIIGREAFQDTDTMRRVAARLAIDIGYLNQQACASARVVYVQTGTDAAGIARAREFGRMTYEALQALPAEVSGPVPQLTRALAEELQALMVTSDEHLVIGGDQRGAIVVSLTDTPIEFAALLTDRVANLVPFDDIELPVLSVNSYTQTIGIYPDSLKERIRDRCVFQGAQRLSSLGYMLKAAMAGPHDGIEPVRRMCKWIVDETSDPAHVTLPTATDAMSGDA